MIENFTPQGFPLEARTEDGTTLIVIGWRRTPGATGVDELEPVVVRRSELGRPRVYSGPLTYRVTTARPYWTASQMPSTSP